MKSRKGFTVMELLIVVAIIAMLIAVAIPVFSSVPEKAREATDAANLRGAYATVLRDGMMGMSEPQQGVSNIEYSYVKDKTYTAIVTAQQKADGWAVNGESATIQVGSENVPAVVGGTWTIVYDAVTGETEITTD